MLHEISYVTQLDIKLHDYYYTVLYYTIAYITRSDLHYRVILQFHTKIYSHSAILHAGVRLQECEPYARPL